VSLIATLALTLGALLAFALAMSRHHRRLFGRPPEARTVQALRILGWLLLAASPLPWMGEHGAWLAFVAWIFCGLPVVGLAVVLVCSFLPPLGGSDSESSAPR
jgi:hypothetical protein